MCLPGAAPVESRDLIIGTALNNACAAVAARETAKPLRMDGGTESKPYAGWCGTGELTTPRDPILPKFGFVHRLEALSESSEDA